jgi:hypothetical protein
VNRLGKGCHDHPRNVNDHSGMIMPSLLSTYLLLLCVCLRLGSICDAFMISGLAVGHIWSFRRIRLVLFSALGHFSSYRPVVLLFGFIHVCVFGSPSVS